MKISTTSDMEAFARPIYTATGQTPSLTAVAHLAKLIETDRAHVAYVDGSVVGAAGAYGHSLATPGGVASAAAICHVAVLPTHRRRGILSKLKEAQLADIYKRGEAVAYLWASEDAIYRRFGYGMATQRLALEWDSRGAQLRGSPERSGAVRLLEPKNVYDAIAPIYARLWKKWPGMFHRSENWWLHKTLADSTLQCAVWEDNAYALYRIRIDSSSQSLTCELDVVDVLADSFEADQEIWLYLLGIDLVRTIRVFSLPIDHPLTLMLQEPGKTNMRVANGIWLRIVDVMAALTSREFGEGSVTIQITDRLLTHNAGVWQVSREEVHRSRDDPDLTVDIADLGSVYLGGFSFGDLARAGRAHERTAGGIQRADRVFRWERKPWSPEFF